MRASALAATLALATVLFGCGGDPERPGPAAQPETQKREAPTPVKTALVSGRTAPLPIRASGQLVPKAKVRLAFKVGGIVERVRVEEGDRVRKGQPLARLDLSEINAKVQEAESALQKAKRDLRRTRQLYRDSVATLEELQNAETAVETRKARLQAARFNRKNAVIKAPESGLILRRRAEVGEQVAPGSPVLTLGATGDGWVVETGLPESDIVRVSRGDSATVTFDAHPSTPLSATVTEIAGTADPRAGTYEVRLTLADTEVPLKPGFIGRVTLRPSGTTEQAVVPARALVSGNGDRGTVLTVDSASQKARRRTVDIARVLDSTIVLSEGLAPGTSVVVAGKAEVSGGERVQSLEN